MSYYNTIFTISVKNGFTLSEVRKIRKELREIRKSDIPIREHCISLGDAFYWSNTPQGSLYWYNIHLKLTKKFGDQYASNANFKLIKKPPAKRNLMDNLII